MKTNDVGNWQHTFSCVFQGRKYCPENRQPRSACSPWWSCGIHYHLVAWTHNSWGWYCSNWFHWREWHLYGCGRCIDEVTKSRSNCTQGLQDASNEGHVVPNSDVTWHRWVPHECADHLRARVPKAHWWRGSCENEQFRTFKIVINTWRGPQPCIYCELKVEWYQRAIRRKKRWR